MNSQAPAAAIPAPLEWLVDPRGQYWEVRMSTKYHVPYYVNIATGETMWTRPEGAVAVSTDPANAAPVPMEVTSDHAASDAEESDDDSDDDRTELEAPRVAQTAQEVRAKLEKLAASYLFWLRQRDVPDPRFPTRPQKHSSTNLEFELRFANQMLPKKLVRHVQVPKITKREFDDVLRVFLSKGFEYVHPDNTTSAAPVDQQFLRISPHRARGQGRPVMDDSRRLEIRTNAAIQHYCQYGDLAATVRRFPSCVQSMQKIGVPESRNAVDRVHNRVYMNDHFFRASLQNEIAVGQWDWMATEPLSFRYMNRLSLVHKSHGFRLDLSMVRSSDHGATSLVASDVFRRPIAYEVELEAINDVCRSLVPDVFMQDLRTMVKFVLCGLQHSMFPIPLTEMDDVANAYFQMLGTVDASGHALSDAEVGQPDALLRPAHFIGPNLVTLQMVNLADGTARTVTNVIKRQKYVVTAKADGERHLLFIMPRTGRVYLLSTNMRIKFTGTLCDHRGLQGTLLDGELLQSDTHSASSADASPFMPTFAAFDAYFTAGKDVRARPLFPPPSDSKSTASTSTTDVQEESRNQVMSAICFALSGGALRAVAAAAGDVGVQLVVRQKQYHGIEAHQNVLDGCREIFANQDRGAYMFKTDGLILYPAHLGVGVSHESETPPASRITWEKAFKWKPPKDNTNDFWVRVKKNSDGKTDAVKDLFATGTAASVAPIGQCKTLELYCGYDVQKDELPDALRMVMSDNIPRLQTTPGERLARGEKKGPSSYEARIFEPTNPEDPTAGMTEVLLRPDAQGVMQMYTEPTEASATPEIIHDNTIVEFYYDLERGKWIPIRVRADKTEKLWNGEKEYGNSFFTCNQNWTTIHSNGRITREMLTGMEPIPTVTAATDQYYLDSGEKRTQSMTRGLRNFHNLGIKKMLIVSSLEHAPGGAENRSLLDLACGKAGDLSKWMEGRARWVLGVDNRMDNIENKRDGACARYVRVRQTQDTDLRALFLCGDSSRRLLTGEAMEGNAVAERAIRAVLGGTSRSEADAEALGAGVAQFAKRSPIGFGVTSCQFALHYFFRDATTLGRFLRNVAETTATNGYFIATCFDGDRIVQLLRGLARGETYRLFSDDMTRAMQNRAQTGAAGGALILDTVAQRQQTMSLIWSVTKEYEDAPDGLLPSNASGLGMQIDVFHHTIGQTLSEWLVSPAFLQDVMTRFGFVLVSDPEAQDMHPHMHSGSLTFDAVYESMLSSGNLTDSMRMTTNEMVISRCNRYFVFRKTQHLASEALDQVEAALKAKSAAPERPPAPNMGSPVAAAVPAEPAQAEMPAKRKRAASAKSATSAQTKKKNKRSEAAEPQQLPYRFVMRGEDDDEGAPGGKTRGNDDDEDDDDVIEVTI